MAEKILTDLPPLTADEINLLKKVEEERDLLIKLTQDLIAIDSKVYDPPRYSDLSQIFTFMNHEMQKYGLTTEYFWCPDPHADPKEGKKWPNLIGKWDEGIPGKRLQFMGHLDVVPYSPEKWNRGYHPLEGKLEKNRIYGRGAVDMKGGIACQILAIKILKQAGIKLHGSIQMWCVPDEEIDGNYGAKYMVLNHKDKVNCDATIISEATCQEPISNPVVIVGEKGSFWFRLKFFGASGHGSMPKPRSNAINKAVRFINGINKLKLPKVRPPMNMREMLKSLLSRYTVKNLIKAASSTSGSEADPYDQDKIALGNFFHNTVSFNQIHAGKKVNIIPDSCELEMDLRVLPGISEQDVMNAITRYATKLNMRIEIPSEFHNTQSNTKFEKKGPVDIKLTCISTAIGTFVNPNNSFMQSVLKAFEEIYHVKGIAFFAPGSSDATHLRVQGLSDVILFGPGGGNAHSANEFVEIDQLIKACKLYTLVAYRFLGQKE